MTPEQREIAKKSLEMIRAGWIQGISRRTETIDGFPVRPSYCMVGAPYWATGGEENGNYLAVASALAAVIREQYPEWNFGFMCRDDIGIVISFNDDPDRTQDQVIAIYEKTLAKEQ